MELLSCKVYTGRNIYSHKTCIKLTIDIGEFCDIPTNKIEGFNDALINGFKGLSEHKCSLGYKGGFIDRLHEGTYIPHVLEHIVIEMQIMLGFTNIKYGKARQENGSIYYVIYEYELEKAGVMAGEYAIRIFNSLIEGKKPNIDEYICELEKSIASSRLGASTKAIYDEAKRRSIPVSRVGEDSILRLGYGKYQRKMQATISDNTSCIAVDISCDKSLTKKILNEISIKVPRGEAVEGIENVLLACDSIGYPVVIKPINGSKGRGVTAYINTREEAIVAYENASSINPLVIVEEFINGKDYRLLVVNKKVVAASMKIPPFVVGDGEKNIKELIEIENENPLRGFGHEKPLTKIKIDGDMINFLESKNKGLDHIPRNKERVYLRKSANISTGGISKDCTNKVHSENIDIAIRAAEAIGLDIAGVDICTDDISKPIRETGGAVLEVNAAPGIRMHTSPIIGKSKDVAGHILDYIYREEEKSIPIVSVTGTNGKTTTARMISHALSMNGYFTGMTTTSGIYIDGKCTHKGDNTGPDSAREILNDKRIEAAVLETARGGILRRGLGYDLADVGVVTNISEDHLGLDGIDTMEDLAYVKSLIVEAVKYGGYAVINADDPYYSLISKRVPKNVNILYFSKNENNIAIKKHMSEGKMCVFLRDEYVCVSENDNIEPIVNINEVPSTLSGKLLHNIENTICSVAALKGLKIENKIIEKSMKTFLSDEESNPGRFNLYKINNVNVIVDYGHNIDAYEKVIASLEGFREKRLIGVIGVPGDRENSSTVRVGEISGNGFDYIYIKEDHDKRGRANGEIANLLKDGVEKSGNNNYEIVLREDEAFYRAITEASQGDTVIVFYEDLDRVLGVINTIKNKENEVKEEVLKSI